MTRKPWAPTPMKAMLTLSLGGTYPGPPNTRRGTIEKPIAAAAVFPKNSRRETAPFKKLRERSRFFTVPPQPQLTDTDSLAAVRIFRWFTTVLVNMDTVNEPEVCMSPSAVTEEGELRFAAASPQEKCAVA